MAKRDDVAARRSIANGRAIAATSAACGVLLLVLIASPLSRLFRAPESIPFHEIESSLRLNSVYLGLRVLVSAWTGVEEGLKEFGVRSSLSVFDSLISVAFLIGATYLSRSLIFLSLSQIVATSVVLLAHLFTTRRLLRRLHLNGPIWPSIRHIREQLGMGAGSFLGSLSTVSFNLLDRIIVGSFLGSVSLAYYVAVVAVALQAQTLAASLLQPIMASASGQRDHFGQATTLVRRGFMASAATSSCLMTMAMVGAMFAGDVLQSFAPIPRLSFVAALASYNLIALSAVPYYLLLAARRTTRIAIVTIPSAALTLFAMLIMARRGASLSAVLGANAIYGIVLFVFLRFIRNEERAVAPPVVKSAIAPLTVVLIATVSPFGRFDLLVCVAISVGNALVAIGQFGLPLWREMRAVD